MAPDVHRLRVVETVKSPDLPGLPMPAQFLAETWDTRRQINHQTFQKANASN